VSVGGVGLATLARGEHPGPSRQLRWNVNNLLAVTQQPVGDVPADALAALDRPNPVPPLPGIPGHRRIAIPASAETAGAYHGLVAGHDLDRG